MLNVFSIAGSKIHGFKGNINDSYFFTAIIRKVEKQRFNVLILIVQLYSVLGFPFSDPESNLGWIIIKWTGTVPVWNLPITCISAVQDQNEQDEQEQEQQQQDQQQNEDQQDQQQQQSQPDDREMTQEEAEQILNALLNDEKDLQEQRKMEAQGNIKVLKDW